MERLDLTADPFGLVAMRRMAEAAALLRWPEPILPRVPVLPIVEIDALAALSRPLPVLAELTRTSRMLAELFRPVEPLPIPPRRCCRCGFFPEETD